MSNKAPTNETARLDIYKMLIEMADRVSQRRQAANSFYLSVNTAIVGASAYLEAVRSDQTGNWIVSVAGFCVSLLWIRNIESYKELNEGKFHVITELEKTLPEKAFTQEWAYLHRDGRKKKYRPFHSVEILVPWVFATVHVLQFIKVIDWENVYFGVQQFFQGMFGS